MLLIVKPNTEEQFVLFNKVCQALEYSGVQFISFSENDSSIFDIVNSFEITKIICNEKSVSDTIKRGSDKNNIEILIKNFDMCSNPLIKIGAEKNDMYYCDECCIQSYQFENVAMLRYRLDNNYGKFFRLYSNFLHSYTCYCGYLPQHKIGTAVTSASGVICLSEQSYHDFKLLNDNVDIVSDIKISSESVKTNFDIAYELSLDSKCLEKRAELI